MVTKKKLITAVVIAVIVTAIVVGAFSFSFINVLNNSKDESIERIETVSELVQTMFYQPVDEDELTEAAIDGMIASLDDPYTDYYNPEEWAEYQLDMLGEYTGIGVQVTYDEENNAISVTHVFKNSPAEKAGVKDGDFIFGADGETFEEYEYQDIVDAIRGEPGTTVVIDLMRGEEQIQLEIVREHVVAEQAFYEMLDDEIGYFELYSFTGNAWEMFKEARIFFEENEAQSIIIDLRNNLGGDLGQVTNMLDVLLPEGKLILTRDREGKEASLSSDKNMWDIPLVVLVNEYSASASELFSIAIQDYDRGPVIGEVTYGKGVVQSVLPLENGKTGIKITTSEYFSPDGRSINKTGVTPDYEIEDTALTGDSDAIMEKALELLRK